MKGSLMFKNKGTWGITETPKCLKIQTIYEKEKSYRKKERIKDKETSYFT